MKTLNPHFFHALVFFLRPLQQHKRLLSFNLLCKAHKTGMKESDVYSDKVYSIPVRLVLELNDKTP